MPLLCDKCQTRQWCADRIGDVLNDELKAAGSPLQLDDRHGLAAKKWAVQLAGQWNWSSRAEESEIAALEERSVTHAPHHSDTCWKRAASRNTCRHRFPMVSVPESTCAYGTSTALRRAARY